MQNNNSNNFNKKSIPILNINAINQLKKFRNSNNNEPKKIPFSLGNNQQQQQLNIPSFFNFLNEHQLNLQHVNRKTSKQKKQNILNLKNSIKIQKIQTNGNAIINQNNMLNVQQHNSNNNSYQNFKHKTQHSFISMNSDQNIKVFQVNNSRYSVNNGNNNISNTINHNPSNIAITPILLPSNSIKQHFTNNNSLAYINSNIPSSNNIKLKNSRNYIDIKSNNYLQLNSINGQYDQIFQSKYQEQYSNRKHLQQIKDIQDIQKYKNWAQKGRENLNNVSVNERIKLYKKLENKDKQKEIKQQQNNDGMIIQRINQQINKNNNTNIINEIKITNKIQNNKDKPHYFMLQLISIQNIFWLQFDQYVQNLKKNKNKNEQGSPIPQLFYRLFISLEQKNDQSQTNSQSYIYPKKITTQILPLFIQDAQSNHNDFHKSTIHNKTGNNKRSYSTDEKFAVYFHSKKSNLTNIIIELILYEVIKVEIQLDGEKQGMKAQSQIVSNQELFAVAKVPLTTFLNPNDSKQKEKKIINNNKFLTVNFQMYGNMFETYTNQNLKQSKVDQVKDKNNPKLKPTNDKFYFNSNNSYGQLLYTIIESQYYKPISKLIPSQYLVNHYDFIPGILGSHLPKIDDMGVKITTSTQAKSFNFEIQKLQFRNDWIEQQITRFQKTFSYQYKKNYTFQSMSKDIQLTLILNNGLKEINRISVSLTQKMERNHQVYDQNNKIKIVTFTHFNCPSILFPVIFNEPECFLILQIQRKVQAKFMKKILNSKVKNNIQSDHQNINLQNIQQFLVPICYSFIEADKIFNNKLTEKRFFQGHYLINQINLSFYLKNKLNNMDSFNQKKIKINEQNLYNLNLNSRNKLVTQQTTGKNTSRNQTSRVQEQYYSNINFICILKQPFFDQTWFLQQRKLQQSLMMRNSRFKKDLISNMLTQEMKIQLQKQKILKNLTKAHITHQPHKKYHKKYKVKQEIKLLENPQILYKEIKKQANNKQRINIMHQLKKFIDENEKNQSVNDRRKSPSNILQKIKNKKINNSKVLNKIVYFFFPFFEYKFKINSINKQSVLFKPPFYKTYQQLFKNSSYKPQNLIQSSHCIYPNIFLNRIFCNQNQFLYTDNSKMPYGLSKLEGNIRNTNNFFTNKDSLSQYGYQKVPLQTLRTQLTQINYNYLILINPLQLKPLKISNNSLYALPNKFYFKFYFWNMQTKNTIPFKIQQQTGQIILLIPDQNSINQLKQNQNNQFNQNQKHKKLINFNKLNEKQKLKQQNKRQLQKENQTKNKKQKQKLYKIFHFQYQNQIKYQNMKEMYLNFIQYLYNGLMQVRIYDQFQQIGKTYFKLRKLIRKRKNQITFVQQQIIYSKIGPIGKLKLQLKSIRKEKRNQNNQKLNKLKDEKQFKQLNQKVQESQVKISDQQMINKNLQKQKILINNALKNVQTSISQLSRIQKFKKLKQAQQNSNQYNTNSASNPQIQRIIEQNYLISEYNLKVFSFKKSYILIELQNKQPKKGIYFLKILDSDQLYYKCYYQSQLKIIRNYQNQLNLEQRQKVESTYKQKLLKFKKLNQNFEVQLQGNQKFVVLAEYLTLRKYKEEEKHDKNNQNEEQLAVFNHIHTINISLIQSSNQSVIISLSRVHIYPQPIPNVITINQFIKKNSKKIISFPFLQSNYIKQNYSIFLNQGKCSFIGQGIDINSILEENRNEHNNMTGNSTRKKGFYNMQDSKNQQEKDRNISPSSHSQQQRNQNFQKSNDKTKINKLGLNNLNQTKNIDFIRQNYPRVKNNNTQNKTKQNNFNKFKDFNFLSMQIKSTVVLNSQKNIIEHENNYNKKQKNKRHAINLNLIPKDYKIQKLKNNKQFSHMNISYKKYSQQQYQVQSQQQSFNQSLSCNSIYLQVKLNQIQDEEVIKYSLFQPIKNTFRLYHQSLLSKYKSSLDKIQNQTKILPKIIGLICEDIEFKTQQFWIQLNLENDYTEIEYKYKSTMYGIRSFQIKVIDPLKYSRFLNCQDIDTLSSCYIQSMLLTVMTPFPSLKSQLTLTLSLSSKQSFYEEPFTFSNPFSQKTIFSLYTSHPWFLQVQQKDHLLQIKGKQQKKIKLIIHSMKIFEEYFYSIQGLQKNVENVKQLTVVQIEQYLMSLRKGALPVVVIGFVSEKIVEYFGVKFKIQE